MLYTLTTFVNFISVSLFLAAYGFPVWLAQVLVFYQVDLAWRGLALALVAPVYIAFGLAVRRARTEYTWPLYSAGYALTAVGAREIGDGRLGCSIFGVYTPGCDRLAVDGFVWIGDRDYHFDEPRVAFRCAGSDAGKWVIGVGVARLFMAGDRAAIGVDRIGIAGPCRDGRRDWVWVLFDRTGSHHARVEIGAGK
jgi:predicted membrane metal-binding protein